MNKEEERYLLNDFFKRCSWIPARRVYERECPDFIVRDMRAKRRIGLELTRYFANRQLQGGSYNRKIETVWEKIKKEINAKIKYITCIISLKEFKLPHVACEQKKFVVELLNCISQYSSIKNSNEEYCIINFDSFPMLKNYLTKIAFCFNKKVNINIIEAISITCGGVGINTDELKQIVNDKKSKINNYRRKNISEFVLLIIATGETLSQVAAPLKDLLVEKVNQVQDFLESAGFNKIFFFERSIGDINLIYPIAENQEWRKQHLIERKKITFNDLNDREKKIVDQFRERYAISGSGCRRG